MRKGRSKQDYETPWEFIKAVEDRYGPLSIDLAASEANKKAPKWLGLDQGVNSLDVDWAEAAGKNLCFLNPPFDHIEPWAQKCAQEGAYGCKILFLVPASIGSNWWRDWVHNIAYVNGLNGRIIFDGQKDGKKDPYPKDLALIEFGFGRTGYGIWRWKT